MRPILWLVHSSIFAAGRLNARNSPFIGTSERKYYPPAQAICRVISTDLKLAPAQSGAFLYCLRSLLTQWTLQPGAVRRRVDMRSSNQTCADAVAPLREEELLVCHNIG